MIKELAKYIKQYKKYAILTPFMVVLEIVMEVVIPYLMARIIDVGIQNNDLDYIIKTGIMLVISAIMSLIFGVLSGRFAAIASAGFAKNLRQGMFYNIQNYSFTNIDKFSTSSLVTRLTTDVTNVQNAFQMIIRALVRGPVMIVFALIMAFSINKELSLVYLITMVPLAILLAFISIKAHPYFEKVFNKYDELNRVVGENLNAIRVVKSFATEDFEEKKFEDVNSLVYRLFKKAEKIVIFNSPLMQIAIYGCILLLSWLGAQTIVGGGMQTGQLSSLITYAWQILSSLMMLSMVLVMIIIAQSSAERIMEVLTEEPTIKNREKTIKEIKDGSIEFIDVDFQYDDAKANEMLPLEDINLKINAGEVIGIIGGTGSSKTSLVNLLPRFYEINNGSILINGEDYRNYKLDELRDNIAYVFQEPVIFNKTIMDNIKFGNKENISEEEIIKVYVTGEVNSPGVIELEGDSRIEDAITLAGGITEKANLSEVNLAYSLEDGQKLYIPSVDDKEEVEYLTTENGENILETNKEGNGKININTASLEKLETLPGVGEALGKRIIEYREENGKFEKIEDLKNVSGIGDKKFESLEEYIVVK